MRRRDLIMLLGGGTAALWSRAGAAQHTSVPVVGFLGLDSAKQMAPYTAWFNRGLSEVGFADGQNIAIEYRWAEDQYDRLPALAADLVQRRVAVIFSSGGTPPLRAAMAATRAIPIIFSLAGDPVKQGIVSSMNRPGGNVTGVTFTTAPLGAKRLELARELNSRCPANWFAGKSSQRRFQGGTKTIGVRNCIIWSANCCGECQQPRRDQCGVCKVFGTEDRCASYPA